MTLDLILLFNLVLLAAIASPGPALLIAIKTTLTHGRNAGLKIGLGLAIMAASWTAMALLGLEIIFQIFPWAYLGIKIIGGFYLLYLAWKTWKSAKAPLDENNTQQSETSVLAGILINLANPKSVLFAASFLIVIFPPDLMVVEKLFIVINHLGVEVICYSIIATIMSAEFIRKKYFVAKLILDRIAAVVIGGLALKILVGSGPTN